MNMGSSNEFLGEVDFWRPAGEGDEGGGQGTVDGLAPGPGLARRERCHGLYTQFYNLTNKCWREEDINISESVESLPAVRVVPAVLQSSGGPRTDKSAGLVFGRLSLLRKVKLPNYLYYQ